MSEVHRRLALVVEGRQPPARRVPAPRDLAERPVTLARACDLVVGGGLERGRCSFLLAFVPEEEPALPGVHAGGAILFRLEEDRARRVDVQQRDVDRDRDAALVGGGDHRAPVVQGAVGGVEVHQVAGRGQTTPLAGARVRSVDHEVRDATVGVEARDSICSVMLANVVGAVLPVASHEVERLGLGDVDVERRPALRERRAGHAGQRSPARVSRQRPCRDASAGDEDRAGGEPGDQPSAGPHPLSPIEAMPPMRYFCATK